MKIKNESITACFNNNNNNNNVIEENLDELEVIHY